MRLPGLWVWVFALGMTLGIADTAFAYPVSQPNQRVYDEAGYMPDANRRNRLNQELLAYEREHPGQQIAVVTVHDLDHQEIEEYANGLFRYWGIGDSRSNTGVLFLISREADSAHHKSRIEVGLGLESVLTDIECHRIITEVVVPISRGQQDPQGAIEAGTHAILQKLGVSGVVAEPYVAADKSPSIWFWLIIILVVILLVYFLSKTSNRRGYGGYDTYNSGWSDSSWGGSDSSSSNSSSSSGGFSGGDSGGGGSSGDF